MKPGSKKWKNFMAKLYGIGAAVVIIGALFKIQHWPMAWVWNSSASLFSIIMLLIVARKVLRYPGFKDFLDQ